ncbi:tetratricopeptide repeat protein [Pectobacterium aquaticum]|uniref:tetratricopeptide repeat protein n=1 Tax=Pectobacterium aquaticum TaxID=2204145 RepID=UPI000E23F0C1|nr:tetratricopeptide repeat protein [Pectobacterium aquaticum]RRO04223.1 tetratricopeptide repeat protein [Pectobacterium aquaticum]
MRTLKALIVVLAGVVPLSVLANTPLADLQHDWSVCQYQTLEANKENCFSTLSQRAHDASHARNDDDATLLIWSGIIDSSWAGAKGGLGALSLVKQARTSLEKAIAIDPNALDGSAWTSLGVLYYQVPGWPVGFGDKKKADEMLKKALTLNPNGIDANYFYGDFLLKEGKVDEAKRYLEKALHAPARQERDIADNGRRREIGNALASIQ